MTNRAHQIYKPEFRFGLGGVSLGNEFNKHTDKDAEATLEAAWAVGVRYFDVAPWYGFGLSERRFGHFLHNQKREDYLLSSKVGKLFKASKNNRHAEIYPLSDSPNDIVFDYTADGVRRSIEDSLQRLGVDSLDVAFVHDISPDFAFFPNGWEEQYEIARKGAFPALSKMRDEGIIRAWGIGVNTPLPILKVMEDADPDVCLCARQYSLVDHASAVNELFPVVRKKNVSLVIGSSLNAGFISGSPRYNYGKEKLQDPRRRDREEGETPHDGRPVRRRSAHRRASVLLGSRCRCRIGCRCAQRSANSGGLQFAASQDPFRLLG
jgi:D-threo-aldose 1-dehydrogenase